MFDCRHGFLKSTVHQNLWKCLELILLFLVLVFIVPLSYTRVDAQAWFKRHQHRLARGPHHLKPSTWRLTIGCLSRFGEDQLQMELPLAVAPSYKYRGGWRNNIPLNTTHLSSLWSLEAFILDSLGSLRGVERLEGEWGGVGGSAGLVGTLLRLYLDGCLFGCKCLRLSYLELEFRS